MKMSGYIYTEKKAALWLHSKDFNLALLFKSFATKVPKRICIAMCPLVTDCYSYKSSLYS